MLDTKPTPPNMRILHTWSIDFYVFTDCIVDCMLLLVYMFTFYKAWKGTRYKFILILTVLLFFGSVGGLGAAITLHKASELISTFKDAMKP